jgi:hypothetical protein
MAAPMVAVHIASKKFGCRIAHPDNIRQQDSAANTFTKLV